MKLRIDATEARVLGSLVEKGITTPDYYPLSLNALINAGVQPAEVDFKFTQDAFQAAAAFNADKKLVVASNMDLSEADAKAFWPIYDGYQKDLQQIDERIGKGLAAYADAYQKGPLPDGYYLLGKVKLKTDKEARGLGELAGEGRPGGRQAAPVEVLERRRVDAASQHRENCGDADSAVRVGGDDGAPGLGRGDEPQPGAGHYPKSAFRPD